MTQQGQRQQNIQAIKFWTAQAQQQASGQPPFATVAGQHFTPASAAAAGATPQQASAFAPGSVLPSAPAAGQSRKNQLAAINQNVQVLKQPPQKGAKIQGLAQAIAQQPSVTSQSQSRRDAIRIAKAIQQGLGRAGQTGSGFLSSIAIPGDIWFPISVLLVLLFVIVPIAGADGKLHTRLGWLWLSLIGQAHVEGESLSPPQPTIQPGGTIIGGIANTGITQLVGKPAEAGIQNPIIPGVTIPPIPVPGFQQPIIPIGSGGSVNLPGRQGAPAYTVSGGIYD